MVVRPETAAQYKLETLTDLAKVANQLKLGAGPEFRDREDGLPGLKAKYGMEFKEDLQMAIGLRYQALASKQIDVVNGYATDGMISALKLKRLKDDKNLWPPYYVVPVVRKEALDGESEDGRRAEPRERIARRGDARGDELQGRRRQDGAARRRARLPESQGHRALSSVRVGGEAGTSRLPIVVAVARHGAQRRVGGTGLRAHRRGTRRRAEAGGGDAPIYGVNSALGANTGQPLDAADLGEYQRRAILARAVGVGPAYDSRFRARDAVRAHRRNGGGRLGRIASRARRARRDAEPRCTSASCRGSDRSAWPTCRNCPISRCR